MDIDKLDKIADQLDSWWEDMKLTAGRMNIDLKEFEKNLSYFYLWPEFKEEYKQYQLILAVLTKYPMLYDKVKDSPNAISAEELVDIIYTSLALGLWVSESFHNFMKVCYNVLSKISLLNIMMEPPYKGDELDEPPQYMVYMTLSKLPLSIQTMLVSGLETDKDIKRTLSKALLNKNEEAFLSLCIENEVDFSPIVQSLYAMDLHKNLISFAGMFTKEEDEAIQELMHLIDDPMLKDFDVNISRLSENLKSCDFNDDSDDIDDKSDMLKDIDIPASNMFSNTYYQIRLILSYTYTIRNRCSDKQQIKELESFIAEIPHFKYIVEKDTLTSVLDSCEESFVIGHINRFQQANAKSLIIPESVGYDRDDKSYFRGDKTWKIEDIGKLYDYLTETNMLSWNVKTKFSFMYRMSGDYCPSRKDLDEFLTPIIWNGSKRDLLSLIWFCNKGDSRIWKKTQNFFLDKNGDKFDKLSGARNIAERPPTDAINEIISKTEFRNYRL